MIEKKTDVPESSKHKDKEDDRKIETGFEQMEMIYKSRCVQMPTSSNVTVREIEK